MSTAAQDIFNRAIALNDANQGFVSGPNAIGANEVLWRLNYAQGQLWARLAQENRFFWVTRGTLASNNAASNRTIDLSTLNPPIERLLDQGLQLPGGVPLNIVDFQDQNAEFAPRGYPVGLVLNEVGADWGPAGIVNFTIVYAYRPADLNLNADLTQAISLPDRFAAYLDLDFGIYFSGKDAGRVQIDPQEVTRLTAMQEAVYKDILQYVDHVVGPAIQRWIVPGSPAGDKA